jgi:hypothetical protein
MALKPWLSRRIPAMAKSTVAKLRGNRKDNLAVDELPPLAIDELLNEAQQAAPKSVNELHPDELPPLPDFAGSPPAVDAEEDIAQNDFIDNLVPISPDENSTQHQANKGETDQYEELPTKNIVTTLQPFSLDAPPPPPPPEIDLPTVQEEQEELPPAPLMPPINLSPQGHVGTGTDAERPQNNPKLLDRYERAAYMRAVNLFHKLNRIGNEGRQGAINRLFEIVVAFPHAASVRAIGNLLDAGCDLHEVEDAAALKEFWRSNSSLWLRRHLGTLELYSDNRHQNHLTWTTAYTLALAMGRDQSLNALQGILLHEWLTMKRDAYSGSVYEFCFYHRFVLKRAQEILGGSMDPILQIYEGTIQDDPVMPSYIQVRNTAPNFTGRPSEKVFLPSIHNIEQISPTFSRQTKAEREIAQDAKGADDA